MNNEITIVTAFFDIRRGGWGSFGRSGDRYISYFKHWARIKNNLVVYVDACYAEEVKAIRSAFGLLDRTIVVPVDEVEQCDRDILLRIETAMRSRHAWVFRRWLDNPESWSVKYNYIMLMKYYFINEAVKKGLASGTIAWMDFGFNHGGEVFPVAEEFDFEWNYPFSPKIHAFLNRSVDELPIFEIVRNMNVYIKGNLLVADAGSWSELWHLCRSAMVSLTACGFADDDQTLLLMAYRERPDLFELHESAQWGDALKNFGGGHLTMNDVSPEAPESRGKRWRRILREKYIDWQLYKRKGSAIYEQYKR
ncbi:hypothetical protein AAV94_01960 [Lampropedia cohaerens]|uniref:Uncharacterized protein n=1 Tax=Lampropedia cohaerens TaxID=1610491 RepID=A0A0U1Q3A3_9BURK|nr:hypothetical protein AAV94_01960 [Lampropedia cohaerens]